MRTKVYSASGFMAARTVSPLETTGYVRATPSHGSSVDRACATALRVQGSEHLRRLAAPRSALASFQDKPSNSLGFHARLHGAPGERHPKGKSLIKDYPRVKMQ
jgi:hypothetical protein